MLGALNLNSFLLIFDDVVQAVKNVSHELGLDIGNLVSDVFDLFGNQKTHLNRNLRDGNLFREFAFSVEFKDFVGVFVGKHDVTLVDLSSVGNSDIDN